MRLVPPTPTIILPLDCDVTLKKPWRGGWHSTYLGTWTVQLEEESVTQGEWIPAGLMEETLGPPFQSRLHCSSCSGQPSSVTAPPCGCGPGCSRVWGLSACCSTHLPSLHPSRKRNQKRTMIRSMGFALWLPGSKPSPTGLRAPPVCPDSVLPLPPPLPELRAPPVPAGPCPHLPTALRSPALSHQHMSRLVASELSRTHPSFSL